MKKASEFIVKHRRALFIIIIAITLFCAFLMPQVGMNTDMSKYLPESSNMKQGVDVMTEEFPDMEMQNTIRVMVTDLEKDKIDGYIEELENIKDVSGVKYEDNEDYHQDNYTLFILTTSLDYDTEEEKAIQQAAKDVFAGYETETKNDNASSAEVPIEVILPAILILIAILFVMSASWIEPLLFLATIGVAVVINMGTNIFMGEVSGITFSIAAVLQLVLSMDYSIILMNRYRQERALFPDDKYAAMKNAIKSASSSVFGSGLTTVVGLIMLVFMSFRIGMDLGLVLAKGVGISMLCVVFFLPCLVLFCDKAIFKTGKKVPKPSMNAIAAFGYKFRHIITVGFAVLFVFCALMQSGTPMTYTLFMDDPIADVFTRTNSIVAVYDNEDERAVAEVGEALKEKDKVREVQSYSLTVGKEYTSEELIDMMDDMGERGFELEPFMLDMIFYRANGGEVYDMTAGEFLTFINDEVLTSEAFSGYIDDDMKKEAERLEYFDTKEELTQPRSAKELSGILGMNESDIKDVFMFNRTENSYSHTSLTLAELCDFINELSNNERYADMMPSDMTGGIDELEKFTSYENVTKQLTYKEAAKMLGADEEDIKMLYLYYFANDKDTDLEPMTVKRIAHEMQKLAETPEFSDMITEEQASQLSMLKTFADKDTVTAQLSAAEMAAMLSMSEEEVDAAYSLYYGSKDIASKTMSLNEFLSYILALSNDPAYSSMFDAQTTAQLQGVYAMTSLAEQGVPLPASQMAAMFTMNEMQVNYIYMMNGVSAMTVTDFLDIVSQMSPDPQLAYIKNMCDMAKSGVQLTYKDAAAMFSMDEGQLRSLYIMYFGAAAPDKTMSLYEFVSFMLEDAAMQANLSGEQANKLRTLKSIMDMGVSKTKLSPASAASLFGTDTSSMRMIYAMTQQETVLENTLALHEVTDYILENEDLAGGMAGEIKTLDKIIDATVQNKSFTASGAASLLSIDKADAEKLYVIYECEKGETGLMSIENFVSFIISDVINNEDYADMIDETQKEDLYAFEDIIAAVINGGQMSAKDMAEVFSSFDMDEGMVEAVYLYSSSLKGDAGTMSIVSLLSYMTDEIFTDAAFEDMITEEQKNDVYDIKAEIDDAITSLKSDDVSIMMIETKLPFEGDEADAFFDELKADMDKATDGGYYLIGTSAMSDEMKDSFDSELLLITILTAVAIFIVVAITFKSFIVPALLVLLVQCGVYLTVILNGLMGYDMYYLALLMVQCILMGATIDYGILYANYFKENMQKGLGVKESLAAAFKGSIHTILTSGLIIIIVTAIIGASPADPTITHILQAISLGAISAVVLIIFILPGLLATFSRFIVKKKK